MSFYKSMRYDCMSFKLQSENQWMNRFCSTISHSRCLRCCPEWIHQVSHQLLSACWVMISFTITAFMYECRHHGPPGCFVWPIKHIENLKRIIQELKFNVTFDEWAAEHFHEKVLNFEICKSKLNNITMQKKPIFFNFII